MEKIILDTDIGNDIDDSLCVAYLLAQKECELLGVTTVCGEPEQRAMMVSAICKQAKKEIPVFPGISDPLMSEQRQPWPPQFAKIGNWPHDTEFPGFQAINFMRETIRKYPGEVTLLAIGPLTNIAVLFSMDREIPSLLKELVLMCGKFTSCIPDIGPLEWNALCDPHATAIVYNSGAKIRSVGLDVTMKASITREQMDRQFTAEVLKPVKDFAGVWFQNADRMVFHDPLAAAVIFDEDICVWETGKVEVELSSPRLMGCTYFDKDDEGCHKVAVNVDAERFFNHFFDTVNNM